MKLKFLENINVFNEHAIRLNDFDRVQAGWFLQIIQELSANRKTEL